ncbi:MAG: hypothetical protein ABEI13_02065, partial [Candidatus Paceibacteria bacterium]
LGYKKFKNPKEYEIMGDYLNTRKMQDVLVGDLEVTYYHRSMESIMQDILRSDFEIIDFAEPQPIEETKEHHKSFYDIHTKIPLFMIFALRKKAS